jgi:hypothetical protein
MKKRLLILFLVATILSCTNKKTEKLTNETLEFYSKKSNRVYRKLIKKTEFDSVFYYYKNGNIFKNGKSRKNGKPFGVWNLYSKNSKLREIREWFVIDGHSRINRVWFLNKKGDTISWRSQDSIFKQKEFINDTLGIRSTSYNVIHFRKDTVELSESMKAIAYLGSPLIRDKNSQLLVLIGQSKNNFNSDFSNEKEVKLDTFYNLTIDKVNQKWFKNVEQKYFTTFGYYFENPGEKTIRGYMLEYAVGNFEKEIDSFTSKTYFEKIIYVKDSVK